ncbi:MAG: YigZ family protein [Meiothermus sp.]|nr:YigZ family protein [Meiothermus sp.]
MLTLESPHTHRLEVRYSRFIARAAPVGSPEEALEFLARVREPEATHNCWAYKVGQLYRFSDDGEPGGTAGRPILSAIEGQGLNGVMVVVTRYYGGVNLGAGGLVRAYGGAAAECLRQAPKREVVPIVRVRLEVPFELTNTVFHLLAGHKREPEEYTPDGLVVILELEEAKLEAFEAQLRDATRGKARVGRG